MKNRFIFKYLHNSEINQQEKYIIKSLIDNRKMNQVKLNNQLYIFFFFRNLILFHVLLCNLSIDKKKRAVKPFFVQQLFHI